MRERETPDVGTPTQVALGRFVRAAASFVLGNVDRLRSVPVDRWRSDVWAGIKVYPGTDELFTALKELGDDEKTDAESSSSFRHPQDPVQWFAATAVDFVLGNVDFLHSVAAGGAEVRPGADELFAALEAFKRAKDSTQADLAEALEAELTGDDPH